MSFTPACHPVTRLTSQVHYGQYEQARVPRFVKNTIGKAVDQYTANIAGKPCPGVGHSGGTVNGSVDFDGEVETQTRFVRFVPIDSSFEFFGRFGVKRDGHCA